MNLLTIVKNGASVVLPQSAVGRLEAHWRSCTGGSLLTCRFDVGRNQEAHPFRAAPEVQLLKLSLEWESREMLLAEGLQEILMKRSNEYRLPIYEVYQLRHPQFSVHLSLPAWSMVNRVCPDFG